MKETMDKVVSAHKVVLFMKGTKDFPQCGFSHTVVQILRSLDVPFETLDVLANDALQPAHLPAALHRRRVFWRLLHPPRRCVGHFGSQSRSIIDRSWSGSRGRR